MKTSYHFHVMFWFFNGLVGFAAWRNYDLRAPILSKEMMIAMGITAVTTLSYEIIRRVGKAKLAPDDAMDTIRAGAKVVGEMIKEEPGKGAKPGEAQALKRVA
jgi:hypothetical protein